MAWAVGLNVISACTASNPRPAPSLLSPAPSAAAAVSPYGFCTMLPVRAQTVSGDGLLNALGPFVPTWLPQGFGLVVGWRSDSSPGGGAIWTDAQCRRITLEIYPRQRKANRRHQTVNGASQSVDTALGTRSEFLVSATTCAPTVMCCLFRPKIWQRTSLVSSLTGSTSRREISPKVLDCTSCSLTVDWVAGLGVTPGHWAHRDPAPHGDPAV